MSRIAIIGGGISGLSAAFALQRIRQEQNLPIEYALFERASRLGGVMVTDRVDDCLIEAGPDSFLTEKPWAIELCKQVGLGDQLIGSNDPDRKTYIVVKNKLIEIPDGLMFMVPTKITPALLSPLFSKATKLRMAREWFHPPHRAVADETVAAMVERHYGPEMVERLADPLLSGVYGGEASQLSVRAVLPRFAEMEAKHGSLGRAMLAARKKMAAMSKGLARPLFTSLKEGMQQMVDAVVARLDPSSLKVGVNVQALESQIGGWTISAGLESDHFDAVILALPASSAASIVRGTSPALADELTAIRYSSSVTVTLGYGENVRKCLPPGFGFLVPRSEGTRMLAATFVHNKFPHRAPADRALIRGFLGGSRDEQILDLSDQQILDIVRSELKKIINLDTDPLFARVYRWKGSMAQYGVGHLERLERIEHLRLKWPGLALAGNGYSGIGVPDCVRSGSEAVAKVLSSLGIKADEPRAAAS